MTKKQSTIPPIEDAQLVTEPKTVKMKALTEEIYNALVTYLSTKPFNEVQNIIVALSQSPTVDVTFNGTPQSN